MGDAIDERVFVRSRKIFRRIFSRTEVAVGAALAVGLVAVAGWVAWEGAHPDPELSSAVALERRAAPVQVDRGPLPQALAPAGWQEQHLAVFDRSNLYVKIDGREGYYKSFGFQRLTTATLVGPGGDPTIDLELYDLGQPLNALGAAGGELPAGASAKLAAGTLSLIDRNALYLARGKHYLRAIGSNDGPAVREVLGALRQRFATELPGAVLPGSYALFVPLGVSPGKVSYLAENAFSFAFAQGVHVGALPDGDTELFAVAAADGAAARGLAARFARGFSEYGKPAGTRAGVSWVDRYLSRVSGVTSAGSLVLGVRGAADVQSGQLLLERLVAAARTVPPTSLAAAPRTAGRGEE
jgi:hypothetical protein